MGGIKPSFRRGEWGVWGERGLLGRIVSTTKFEDNNDLMSFSEFVKFGCRVY